MGASHIMNDVIYAIDRADLVIADLTGSNPNVFYELGITHALGRACIAVMEEHQKAIEFDLSAYRVFRINLDEAQFVSAQNELRPAIEAAHESISDWSRLENPVIDFFRAPVTYISPAFALAQGYYHNFVRPILESMIRMQRGRFNYQIGIAEDVIPSQLEQTIPLTDDIRNRLELHIIVPLRIDQARHRSTDRLMGHIPAAMVEGDGRSYTCFYRRYDDDTKHALVDIPTTIRVMEDAVQRRMRFSSQTRGTKEWREVELQEIQRFMLALQSIIRDDKDSPEFNNRVRIFSYDSDSPGDLLWLHNALNL
jgi:hypothetical protein